MKSVILDPLPKSVHDATQASSRLSTAIEEEKLKSRNFEKYLQNLVNDSDPNETNIPDISGLPPWSVFEDKDDAEEISRSFYKDSVFGPEVSVWRYGRYELDRTQGYELDRTQGYELDRTMGQPRFSDKVIQLEEDLRTQRRASDVYELQLQRWIQEGEEGL